MSVKTATNTSTCSSPFGGARRGIPPYPAPCFFRICVYQPIRISVFTVPLFQKTQNLVRHGVPFSASLVLNRVLTHVAETLQLFPSMHWGACTSRWPLRRFVECGSGSHVVPLTIFPRMRLRARRAEAWRRPGFSEQFPRQ